METVVHLIIFGLLWMLPVLTLVSYYEAGTKAATTLGVVGAMVLWFLARHEEGAHTLNGFGTKLYGKHRTQAGYVTTKWIVWGFLPLMPVRSVEVITREETEDSWNFQGSSSTTYYTSRPHPFYWPQVVATLLLGWAVAAAVLMLIRRLHH
jgi:hypothetical protein